MKRESVRRGCAALAVGALAGCTSAQGWVPPVSGDDAGAMVTEHRVYAGPCVFPPPGKKVAPLLAMVGGIFLKEAAGATIKTFGEALKEAGAQQVWRAEDNHLVTLGGGTDPQCVQLVRGPFLSDPTAAPLDAGRYGIELPNLGGDGDGDGQPDALVRLAQAGIWLGGQPDYLIEFQTVPGENALGFQLNYIHYGRPARPVRLGYDNAAALGFEFALLQPSQPKGTQGAPVAQLVLGSVQAPHAFRYLPPFSWRNPALSPPPGQQLPPAGQTPPLSATPAPAAGGGILGAIQQQAEQAGAPDTRAATSAPPNGGDNAPEFSIIDATTLLPKSTNFLPITKAPNEGNVLYRTLVVSMVETDPGNPFLVNLGTALSNQTTVDAVRTAVGEVVVPSEREAARLRALDAQKQAVDGFYEAWAAAATAIVACEDATTNEAPNAHQLCVTAEGKKRVASILAEKAGIKKPYGG